MRNGRRRWSPGWGETSLHLLLLAVAVVLVWGRCVRYPFVDWDDAAYVIENRYLAAPTADNVRVLLTPGGIPRERLYIPLTYLSYMAEIAVFGLRAGAMHTTNLLLHLLNVGLLYVFLKRLTRRPLVALVGAALWAIHPLQAESVCWIMGRKDLLSATGALVTLLAWDSWGETQDRRWYLVALAAWAAALLSKPSILLLPLLLPLLDRGRDRSFDGRVWLAWAPFLLLAGIAVVLHRRIPAAEPGMALTPAQHAEALAFTASYLPPLVDGWLARLLLVARPYPFYAVANVDTAQISAWGVLPVLALLGALWVAWRTASWRVLLALTWTILFAAPMLGVLLARNRSFITADRYGYLALAGMCVLLPAGVAWLTGRWRQVAGAVLGVFLVATLVAGARQAGVWRHSLSLWEHQLAADPDLPMAWNFLGNWAMREGRYDEAIRDYRRAIAASPDYAVGYVNTGIALRHLGRLGDAVDWYRRALRAEPRNALALTALGEDLRCLGNLDEATAALTEALAVEPDFPPALYNLGVVAYERHQWQEAANLLSRFLHAAPDHVAARFQLARCLEEVGQDTAAVHAYQLVLARQPGHRAALYDLADLYMATGRALAAKPLLQDFVGRYPHDPDLGVVYFHLGIIARLENDPRQALSWFNRAQAAGPLPDSRAHLEVARAAVAAGDLPRARDELAAARDAGVRVPPDLAARVDQKTGDFQ